MGLRILPNTSRSVSIATKDNKSVLRGGFTLIDGNAARIDCLLTDMLKRETFACRIFIQASPTGNYSRNCRIWKKLLNTDIIMLELQYISVTFARSSGSSQKEVTGQIGIEGVARCLIKEI